MFFAWEERVCLEAWGLATGPRVLRCSRETASRRDGTSYLLPVLPALFQCNAAFCTPQTAAATFAQRNEERLLESTSCMFFVHPSRVSLVRFATCSGIT